MRELMKAHSPLVTLLLFCGLLTAQPQANEDASALEVQYKTCAKHYIPAEKCTPEIYQQLKAKDDAPLDPKTAVALKAVKAYQSRLKNSDSMQVHTAYVTERGAVCLEIAGQNSMGGMSVSRVVYLSPTLTHREKEKWLDEGGFLGGMAAADHSGGYQVDRWGEACTKPPTPSSKPKTLSRNRLDGEGQGSPQRFEVGKNKRVPKRQTPPGLLLVFVCGR